MRPAAVRRAVVVGASAPAVAVSLLPAALGARPALADPPLPPAPVPVVAPAADVVCPALFGYTDDTMRIRDAKAIMLGDVDMGAYGHLTIPLAPENPLNPLAPRLQPTWKPQSTLDLAGNRYQHALRWTLPLLRVGMDPAGNPETRAAFVAQFVALLRSWVASQPAPNKRDVWVNHPQYGGFRLGVFVCAARELPDPVDNAWMVAQARAELNVQLSRYFLSGANNTMLNSQLAAYAAALQVGTQAQQAQARRNVLALTSYLTNADGSDKEGAPGYGLYLATILARAATVFEAYGRAADAATVRAAIARSGDFITAASRPDRQLETLGDTAYGRIQPTLYGAGSTAAWVATSGELGREPTSLYSSWSGGYAFGHSGWVAGEDEKSTFYSVRTAKTTPNAAHRHSDSTAVTFYSRGVSWVADPGPFRYDTSALRGHLRGRTAHSALVAAGSASFVAPARWVRTSSKHGIDTTCLRDSAYERSARVEVVRCVYYVRELAALVVQDVVRPTAHNTDVRQQFVLPPEVRRATVSGSRVTLTGRTPSDAERTAVLATTGRPQVQGASGTRAVLGRTYGVAEKGRLLTVPWRAPVGLSSTTTSVLTSSSGAVAVAPTRAGGEPVLRVTVGGRSVVVPTGFDRFNKPGLTLPLKAAKAKVKQGKQIVLQGKVAAAGRKLPGVTVTVQRYAKAKRRWVTAGTARTDAKGRYTKKLRATSKGTRAYRASVPGTPAGPRAGSAARRRARR